ncbi:DNA polymerase delta small subunit Cdc1 [Malassezia brasiliensis]|uniref:DNA polymerase delta small subunit Cdc1 n=1 Tax=Malassezia brasiliensis TaxID=1821822 RepID=A0AAF0DVM0_9BASI|nr:DNA polymerase delta small subunit Cdc1 [Malassezia brasiliensis]
MDDVRRPAAYDALDELSSPLRIPAAERSYSRQFAQVYDYRLAVLRRRVLAAATEQFGGAPPYVERVLDIPPKRLCFVIGTVYASMRLKPDVLQEIARDQSIVPQPVPTYADPGHDELFIEDQSGRVRLVGEKIAAGGPLANKFVTGAVVGVFGAETPDGDLEVADVACAGLPPPRALPHDTDAADAPYVVLASGLAMGGSSTEHDMAYELLLDWVSGALGQRSDAARISSLVLAGDSVQRTSWAPREAGIERAPKGTAPPASLASDLDPLLAELCATLDAVVMLPGANDPSSATLPQQPLLGGLLPRASAWPSLHRVTNPAWFALHGRTFLATAGQNVDDLVKYAVEDSSDTPPALAMALATLDWSHVAPTAPDTLWSYPFQRSDPFVLRAAPDVYVVGNQERYATATYAVGSGDTQHHVRVVLIPSFARTHEVVLLNMATLEPRVVALRT